MASPPCVAVLAPNLFLRVTIDAAVRAAGAEPIAVGDPIAAAGARCKVVVVDLDALGDDAAAEITTIGAGGAAVLGFGPHVHGERLAAARAAGAVVMPRAAFLQHLPELLATALRGA